MYVPHHIKVIGGIVAAVLVVAAVGAWVALSGSGSEPTADQAAAKSTTTVAGDDVEPEPEEEPSVPADPGAIIEGGPEAIGAVVLDDAARARCDAAADVVTELVDTFEAPAAAGAAAIAAVQGDAELIEGAGCGTDYMTAKVALLTWLDGRSVAERIADPAAPSGMPAADNRIDPETGVPTSGTRYDPETGLAIDG